MNRRSVHLVPLVMLFLLSSPRAPDTARQGTHTLRIESLSQSLLRVRITLSNIAAERSRVPPRDTIVTPPTSFPITDSIGRVRIVVIGFGVIGAASVRATLTSGAAPADSLVSVGRDITLSRKPNGRFERIWTTQPLVP